MARYIDADKLIEALQMDFDREGTKANDMAMSGNADLSVKYSHGQFCYLNAIERVKDTPTADVVSRAELSIVSVQNAALIEANQNLRKQNTEYKIEIEAMRMAANSYKMHLEDLKTEVARELLSDLKKAVHDKAVYSYSKEMYPYINLKVFDAIVAEYIGRLEGKR